MDENNWCIASKLEYKLNVYSRFEFQYINAETLIYHAYVDR